MGRTSSQFVWCLMLLGVVTMLTGCRHGDRPPLGYVSGTVTMNGEPLAGVIVTSQPTKGRAAQGLTDAQGKYELTYLDGVKGAKVGPCRVTISWPLGFTGTHVIPARYAEKTELTCDVRTGRNKLNFELESDPGAKPPVQADE